MTFISIFPLFLIFQSSFDTAAAMDFAMDPKCSDTPPAERANEPDHESRIVNDATHKLAEDTCNLELVKKHIQEMPINEARTYLFTVNSKFKKIGHLTPTNLTIFLSMIMDIHSRDKRLPGAPKKSPVNLVEDIVDLIEPYESSTSYGFDDPGLKKINLAIEQKSLDSINTKLFTRFEKIETKKISGTPRSPEDIENKKIVILKARISKIQKRWHLIEPQS